MTTKRITKTEKYLNFTKCYNLQKQKQQQKWEIMHKNQKVLYENS